MKQNRIDFAKLLKPYKKGWVAISGDFKRVLFYDKNLKSLMKKSKKIEPKVYYYPSGDNYSNYVGKICSEEPKLLLSVIEINFK